MTDAPLNDEEIAESADKARDSFDLKDFLRGINRLSETVKVYTDEPTGKELGGANDVRIGDRTVRQRWGILGEVDALMEQSAHAKVTLENTEPGSPETDALIAAATALVADNDKKIKALKKKATPFVEKLEMTALTFEFQAIPPFLLDACDRKARKKIGAKKGGMEDEQAQQFGRWNAAYILSEACIGYTHGVDSARLKIDADSAYALKDYLPQGEWAKLDSALARLQFQNYIGQQVAESADF